MPDEVGLNNKPLLDLILAGLNASGFSELQKTQIMELCGPGLRLRRSIVDALASLAKYRNALSPAAATLMFICCYVFILLRCLRTSEA